MNSKELKTLSEKEEQAFQLIQNNQINEVIKLINEGQIRVNCLDKSGMSLLDQACFKGDERLAEFLIQHGANVDNRAHEQGYTCLMFAALAGNPSLCQRLLSAGARSHTTNSIGKTAAELAAFVGQHECVSVINSFIGIEEIERIVHPRGADSEERFPQEMIQFLHQLTSSHEIHPVRLAFAVSENAVLLRHRKKILHVVDTLFERQLRTKEPNEVMSMKLWLIFFTLRELLDFTSKKAKAEEIQDQNEEETSMRTAFERFALILLEAKASDLVRPNEERFLRTAVSAFPYKQSMLHQTLMRSISQVELGSAPSAYTLICQALFGPRFVQTAHFCLTCGVPSAKKRCKACKFPYCSKRCQQMDSAIHKRMCKTLAKRREEMDEKMRAESRIVTQTKECTITEKQNSTNTIKEKEEKKDGKDTVKAEKTGTVRNF